MKRAGKEALTFISMIRKIKILSGAFQEATIKGRADHFMKPFPLILINRDHLNDKDFLC